MLWQHWALSLWNQCVGMSLGRPLDLIHYSFQLQFPALQIVRAALLMHMTKVSTDSKPPGQQGSTAAIVCSQNPKWPTSRKKVEFCPQYLISWDAVWNRISLHVFKGFLLSRIWVHSL
jgi:hypothetical protein